METRTTRCLRHGLLASTALAGLGLLPAAAGQLPTGYSTSFGSVGFQRSSGTLNINQSSPSAIVNYNSFSIGRHARVDIHQPGASSVLLNRVTGATGSVIAGRLKANGQVYLINPNGIAITKSGVVKVGGGFVASSLDMSDDEFKGNRQHFSGNGGRVSNRGTITIGRGGYAALIGGKVMNGGTIAVPMGTVAMGAGQMATLDVSGDGFLQVALPSTAGGKGSLITNAGRISGATVMIDAATARAAARNAVNISGTIDSHTISGHSGSIQIGGGDGGAVAISGRLSVASRHATGGSVTITGNSIALHHAHVDARGALGGGSVRIGGDLHGGGTLPHASTVTIDKKSVITADATKNGNGGSVVVWSDETTHFAGLISAKGGAQSGDGGSAEVSSHGVLAYTGTTNLLAPKGTTGTLLLDPYDVVISGGTDSNTSTASSGGTTTYTPSGTSVISNTELQTQLATANVTITTGGAGSPGTDAGNITVAAPVTWSSGSLLTLTAANAIAINAPITITGAGGLALNAATTSSNVQSAQPLLSFGNGASVTYAAGTSGTGIAGQSLSINGAPYTLVYSLASLQTAVAANTGGKFALATSVDGSTGGSGYTGAVVPTLSGTLEGLGNTITGLTINAPSTLGVGFVGTLNAGGTVRDLGLIGGSVDAYYQSGGLVGNNSGTITQSYNTGSVNGSSDSEYVGGLVGSNSNSGTITQSYSTGAVNGGAGGNGSSFVGGLVGGNSGTITQSYSTATVDGGSASQYVGGLVGSHGRSGTITQSYATGTVSGFSYVGGLIGGSGGTVTRSYATGTVNPHSENGGGLIGDNEGNISQSYATGAVNGGTYAKLMGGLVGTNGGTITQSYATGSVSGESFLGGLVGSNGGYNGASITQSYATGAVTGYLDKGGLVGSTGLGSTITNSYYDAQTTGQASGPQSDGSVGLSTAVLANASTLAALNSNGAVWGNAGNNTTPYLLANSGPVYLATDQSATPTAYTAIVSVAGLQAINTNLAGNYVLGKNLDATGYAGFTPIGQSKGFTGTFNGFGSTISNLTISTSATSAGLFGEVDSGGTVTNVGLVGGSVTDTADNAQVGGLVGYNYGGTVTQAYTTGTISGGGSRAYVGGLVGNMQGGTITQSYATGVVSGQGSGTTIGGLVGINYQGTISQAYATGTVVGGASASGGGLVGFNNGPISLAYATGAVRGGANADLGGLVGDNPGSISQAYATGAVGGDVSATIGGLAGYNSSTGTITQAYATGAVGSGTFNVGGLVGFNANTITQAYWDTATSGTKTGVGNSSSSGVTGLTTAQLQSNASGYMANLGSAFSGGTGGLYPYLTTFSPNGVQAVSGFAYKDSGATVAASGAAGAVTVSLDANGGRIAQVTTGANGYYYAFVPAGTVAAGASLLVSTAANAATGMTNSATLTSATAASGNQTGVALYGNTFSTATSALLLSQAPSLATAQANATTTAGTDRAAATAVAGTTGQLLIATGASFTIDQAVTTGGAFNVATAAGAPLTVAAPITITGAALTLASGGTLAIDAPIIAQGAVPVTLAYNTSAVTNLSFAQGDALTYTDTSGNAVSSSQGGTLRVNGAAYTLEYGLASLQSDVAANAGGRFALATSVDGTNGGAGYTGAVVPTLGGTLEGLGNNVTGLTIKGTSSVVGLIGSNSGMVRDIGLIGGRVAGVSSVGDLVAINSGMIVQAYATGAVSGNHTVGGLVAYNTGTIAQAYATGAVSGAADTVGGLVGQNAGGTVMQVYATGAVSGGSYNVGGLVAYNTGTITQAYATGAVNGSSTLGGLVGFNNGGTVSTSAYDNNTTGRGLGIGAVSASAVNTSSVTTLTTAALQSTGTTNPFGANSGFAGGAAGGETNVYPYLTSFFPDGVQAITGTAQTASGTSPAGAQVGFYAGGTLLGGGTVSAGANGYVYQAVAAGTLPVRGAKIGATVVPSGGTTAAGFVYTDAGTLTNNALALGTIATGLVNETTSRTSLSGLAGDVAATFGAVTLPTSANAATSITATGASFMLDQAVTAGGSYSVSATGPLTLASTLAASGRAVILGSAGTITLASGGTLTAATTTLTGTGFAFNNSTPGSFATTASTNLRSLGGFTVGHAGDATPYTVTDASLNNLNVGSLVLQPTANGSDAGDIAVFDPTITNTAPITLSSVRNIAFGGTGATASSFAGNLILAAPGTVTQTGALTVFGTLAGNGSTIGSVALGNSGNIIPTLGAFAVNTAGAGFLLSDAASGGLMLAGSLNTGAAGLALNATQGAISQSAGTIIAGTLSGQSKGGASFNRTNRIASLGAFSDSNNGSLSLTSGVATLSVTGNVALGTGKLTLSNTVGSIIQTSGMITAGGLAANASGAITLAAASNGAPANAVGTLAGLAASSGAITLTDGIDLTNQGAVQAGGAVLIAVNGTFTNAYGATVQAGNGSSFAIYTQNPLNATSVLPSDRFAGLTGTNYYNDAFSFGSTQFATALPAGNHFVYAYAATLTPTLTGSATKVYDGTATAPTANLTTTPAGFENANGGSDAATLTFTSATYDTPSAGAKTVTANGIGFASNPNNYTLSATTVTGQGTISPRAVTLAGTQVYDGTTNAPAANLTVTNIVGSDNAGLSGTGTMTSRNVGANTLVSTNGALAGLTLSNGNYTLAGGSGMMQVTPASIVVTAAPNSKIYDGTTAATALPTINPGALKSGDTVALSESYATSNAGTRLALTPMTVINDGYSGRNYVVVYVASTAGVISARPVSLSGTQVYDGTTNAPAANLTVTNIVGSDNAGLSGTGTMTSRNVGANTLVSTNGALAGLTLSNGNYTLAGGSGMMQVTPASIVVTAAPNSKIYDGTTTAAAPPIITMGAVQTGDTIALSESYATSNAGTGLTLTPTATISDNNGGHNYILTLASSGNGTITPATLTYVANAASSTYGSAPTGLTGSVVGFANGQTAANATTGTLVFTTLASGSSNVGSYAISGGGLTANNSNYMFVQSSDNAKALTVNPATLTVSGSKTYDGTNGFATGQLAVSGAVNGETVSLTSGIGTTTSADVGSYVGSSLSNLGIRVSGGNAMASNYALPGTGTGTLTIGKATVTVAGATGVDKTYDGTTSLPSGSSGFTYTGVFGNNATVAAASAQYAGADAGPEAVNVAGLTITGAGAGNYVLSSTSVQGAGTITPATIVVSANGGRSIYGNIPGNPGLSVSGLQGGQGVGVLTGLSSSFALTDRTHAGSYTLSVRGMLTNGNYRVTGTSDGVFVIDPRALTVTASNQSRRFGQDNPPLTYEIGGMGLVNGDTLAGTLTTTAMRDSRGGVYPIAEGTLAAGSDYALTYVPGALVVGAAPVVASPAPVISAAGLASTAERADQQVLGLPGDSLPLAFSTVDGNSAVGSQIIDSLTDPRFDQVVVCVKDLCVFAAPRPKALMKQSSLETSR